jgi:hypothetical protein
MTSACAKKEKTMAESSDRVLADLHTRAAYAHMAAAHDHSTGDHASAQELAQLALGDSVRAVKFTEEVARDTPRSMQV